MDNKLQTTIRRALGLLLAFAIALALLPQASYAASKQYNTSGLRIKTNGFNKKNISTQKGVVKVHYPVIGFVDADVTITMIKSDPYTSWIDNKTSHRVTFRVKYKLTSNSQKKIKKNSSQIVKKLKTNYAMYPYNVFLLDAKTGKVQYSSALYKGINPRSGVWPTKKTLGKLNIVTACEYEFATNDFLVDEEKSFIFGIASPNDYVTGTTDLSKGNSALKNAKKFYNGKLALKKSIYYKSGNKSRSLWIKFDQKAKKTK